MISRCTTLSGLKKEDKRCGKNERVVEGKEPLEGWEGSRNRKRRIHYCRNIKNLNSYEEAVNIPNQGYIVNLPDEVIVEVPAIS